MLQAVNWDDVSLYERQVDSLVASWQLYAAGSVGASAETTPATAASTTS